MDRRALKVYPRRTTATRESENTTSTGNTTYLPTQPLKDNSNIRIIKFNAEQAHLVEQKQQQQLVTQTTAAIPISNGNNNVNNNNHNNHSNTTTYFTNPKVSNTNTTPTSNGTSTPKASNTSSGGGGGNERPLKCLETLAQKAGITFDEKYDFAPLSSGANTTTTNLASTPPPQTQSHLQTNKTPVTITSNSYLGNGYRSFTLEKSQSPAQQVAPGTVPLQISPEQLQQLQQYHQLQHGSPFAAIQVKQEFPTQQHTLGGPGNTGTEIKHQGLLDAATQGQLQQMQMQLAQAAADASGGGGPNSPANQHTPTSAGAVAAMQQQHSTTISTMSPMQLATATGQVTATGDWTQGRTVQLMQPSTGFIYPHMLVPGNLIQSGLGQQPIQVIAAGKPFQGGTPQMIATTQNTKQMAIGGNTGFPSGTTYAIPSSQSPQTLLFSPVNVISQSPQQQQQNILQAMTAAANAQQQQQQQQKGAVDAQKNLQQKVVQKVTTTNTVQSAAGAVAAAQQQQQQATQQCVQVNAQPAGMSAGTTQIISPLQQATGQPQPLQINASPWVQSVPFWSNGLQQLAQNPIIIRGTQADGTPGVFIQQPSGQTLQSPQTNQITLQCNVTQTPTKQRTQLDQLAAAKQQQTGQTHTQQVVQQQATQLQVQQQQQQQQVTSVQQQQQQQAVVQAHLQQQAAAAAVAAVNQQRGQTQILPQAGGAQIRPASSVSTQTAQNQSLLKQKMRTKQQAVRPALPAMKNEPQTVQQVQQQQQQVQQQQQQQQQVTKTTTVAGLQQQISAAVAAQQQQQQQQQQGQPTMHQVVTSAGNKMVVMSAGTPITIQNGQTLQQAVDKQQQQQQLQLQQIQKQQQQYLQQQLIQQQFAQIQLQHQQQQQQAAVHQQQQQQLQQVVAAQQQQQQQQVGQQTQQQQPQIQLQVGPQGFITAQQQQQLQNQLLQQQQQLQQQHQQQQRDQQQSQNIIHQIVVQQSPQQQQQQQQQQQTQQLQQQITAVPFSVSSSTPASIATSQALQQHVTYQTKTSNSLPTTSVVTISNQTGPLVTSTVGLNQASAQLQQQQLIAATIAASQQQQQQQQQQQHQMQQQQQQQAQHLVAVAQQQQQTVMPPPSSPAQNPILAMASMMNAAAGGNLTGNNSLTTAVGMTSPMGNTTTTNISSLPATPTKTPIEQLKTVSSAPSTPSTATVNANTAGSAPSTPVQLSTAEPQIKDTPTKSNDSKTVEASATAAMSTTTSTLSSTAINSNTTAQQSPQQLSPTVATINHIITTPTETPQLAVQPMDTTEPSNEPVTPLATKQSNTSAVASTTQTTESNSSVPTKSLKFTNAQQSGSNESEKSSIQIAPVVSSSPDESSPSSGLPAVSTTSSTSCTTSITTTSSTTSTSSTFSTSTTTSTTTSSSTPVTTKSSGPPPKATPGATIVKVEKDLPKAMIKPNVLTHVIDGFIIQEANEPFPVTRKRYTDKDDNDEMPQKKQALEDATNNTNNNSLPNSPLSADMVACEQCGKPEHKTKLKKKRFCSPACARQAKASIGEQVMQAQQQQQQQSQQQQQQQQAETLNHASMNNINESNNISLQNNSSNVDISNSLATAPIVSAAVDRMHTDATIMQSLPMATTASQSQMQQPNPPIMSAASISNIVNETTPPAPSVAPTAASAVEQQPQMANWTVSDVCEFIKNLPGCSDYVDDFEQQEIDGQALLLLKENHLVNAMGMKLGPALKIVAKVESMKEVTAAALNAANNAIESNNANSQ